MNNLNYDVKDLVRLQQVDQVLSHNLFEIEKLRDNEELKSRKQELEENEAVLMEANENLADLERERKKFEDNISLKSEKIKKNEERLSSGTITNAKELVSLQEEIVSLKKVIEELENKMLDIMIKIDDKTEEVQEFREKVEKLDHYVSKISDEIDAEVDKIEQSNEKLACLREEIRSRIPQNVYEDYENVKKRKSNVAVGVVKENVCSACHMELSVTEKASFKDLDVLYRCPLCRRTVVLHSEAIDRIEEELSEYKV